MRGSRPSLLSVDEPSMVIHRGRDSIKPMLLVCEHAGCGVPKALNGAYPEDLLKTHFASDLGAGALVRALRERLGVSAVEAYYSRLVIDANRRLDDPSLTLASADGMPVDANIGLDPGAFEARVNDLYLPFHFAVDEELQRLTAVDPDVVYVAVHSFTPDFAGERRPWHAGIMWDKDERVARYIIEGLRAYDGLMIGDNQPYSGQARQDFSVDYHAERNGFANVALEIRQDLIADSDGVNVWVDRLAPLFEAVLSQRWPRRLESAIQSDPHSDHEAFETAARQWIAP